MEKNTLEKLTDQELLNEIIGIEQSIEYCGVSKRDLILQDWLWQEADRRGLEIKKTYTL